MKLCADHWQALRTRIYEAGVSDQIAPNGEEAMRRAVAGEFDPLMAANNAIWAHALDVAGLGIMAPNEDGSDRCPLCWMNQQHKANCPDLTCTFTFNDWIDKAADEAITEGLRIRSAPPL